MNSKPTSSRWMAIMTSPWAILSGLTIGVVIGIYDESLAYTLGPAGDLYLNMLKMCILPFLLSAVTVNLVRLLRSHEATLYMRKMAVIFSALMVFAAAIGAVTGFVLQPGHLLDQNARKVLGQIVNQSQAEADLEVSLSAPLSKEAKQETSAMRAFAGSVAGVIPENVFRALSEGNSLQVLVFALLFGLALGVIPHEAANGFIDAADSVYFACQKLIRWVNVLLPFALAAMIAQQVAKVGVHAVFGMMTFLISLTVGTLIFLFVCLVIISVRSKKKITLVLSSMREPLLLAAGTRSSLACIPSCIESLNQTLGLQRSATELVVPLGMTLCRFGPIMYYTLATVFMAQLYQVAIGTHVFLMIVSVSVLAGLSGAGASGIVTLTLMGVVFKQVHLPLDAALILFIAVEPAGDVLRTISMVIGNCAATALIAPRETSTNLTPGPA